MLESALDYHKPLTSISASPPESAPSKHHVDRSSYAYDSIIGDDDRRSFSGDSIFDKTGNTSSMSAGSVFGNDDSHPPHGNLLPPNQFRPVSMFSFTSVHSPNKEDDTMISVSLCQYLKSITSLRTPSSRCLAAAMFVAGPSKHHLACELRRECKLPPRNRINRRLYTILRTYLVLSRSLP